MVLREYLCGIRSPSNISFLLKSLTATDSAHLLVILLLIVPSVVTYHYGVGLWARDFIVKLTLMRPLYSFTQLLSALIVVLVCKDRFLLSWNPRRAEQLEQTNAARGSLLLTLCFSAGYSLPNFFFLSYELKCDYCRGYERPFYRSKVSVKTPAFILVYRTVLPALLRYFYPMNTIFCLNGLLFRERENKTDVNEFHMSSETDRTVRWLVNTFWSLNLVQLFNYCKWSNDLVTKMLYLMSAVNASYKIIVFSLRSPSFRTFLRNKLFCSP